MPANRKRPDLRQDNRPQRLQIVQPGPRPTFPVPGPRRRWLKVTTDGWTALWRSEQAGAITECDLPVVRRLFDLRDLQVRAMRRHEAQPYVVGSKGQPVSNPAGDEVHQLERTIVALEDRFGLSPKARAALGIAIGQAVVTAQQLTEMARERRGHEEDEEDDDEFEAP